MTEPLPAAPESREIRVFLSSTFRDFMQERDLLVKQVFPALRRRAQERGVEIVDVDLRWGITEEESQQGKVIGICLAEIERCRPYFIGMLGERYGWTPPPGTYPNELFERDQLQWLKPWLEEHQDGTSVTELEILHGVLNDKEMAGRAFFYLRDPAWSRAQSEAGFVCDTAEEEARLADLKQRISNSGFPVKKNLADPQAIANQIEADLWELIDELYPDLDTADALEREAREHASYRQSRLRVYLGGEAYISELESWIQSGEQKILITGESGSGKSALIANWMAAHQVAHPEDVVFAHHLGCSNDANAIRPLLARMLDTASGLLVDQQLISEPIKLPQDWWELTAKMAETLQDLGRWCKTTGHRWIWVLDGLDRLAEDDQQALAWLPPLIPDSVSVVISALGCPASPILQERQFRTLEIGPLQRSQQVALIDQYLERYTKKLTHERREQILSCEQASSPLFLKVLLEELRQCGRYETLKDQIEGYTRPNADGVLGVDDLYERVLERLEIDFGREKVKKVMSALWASRAGLSESELLGITGLTPLQWVLIDLALEKGLGRNGNRLVFDHEYLRRAVENRYLPSEEEERQSHSELAKWFGAKAEWDTRKAEELPWQLIASNQHEKLRSLVVQPDLLARIVLSTGTRNARAILEKLGEMSLLLDDGALSIAIKELMSKDSSSYESIAVIMQAICLLLFDCGVFGSFLAGILEYQIARYEDENAQDELMLRNNMMILVECYRSIGNYDQALNLQQQVISQNRASRPVDAIAEAESLHQLALIYVAADQCMEAIQVIKNVVEIRNKTFGARHPATIHAKNDLALFYGIEGHYGDAEAIFEKTIPIQAEVLGKGHYTTLIGLNSFACLSAGQEKMHKSLELFTKAYGGMKELKGDLHPDTLTLLNNIAVVSGQVGQPIKAVSAHEECLRARRQVYGPWHSDTLQSFGSLGSAYIKNGNLDGITKLLDALSDIFDEAPIDRKTDIEEIRSKLKRLLADRTKDNQLGK